MGVGQWGWDLGGGEDRGWDLGGGGGWDRGGGTVGGGSDVTAINFVYDMKLAVASHFIASVPSQNSYRFITLI